MLRRLIARARSLQRRDRTRCGDVAGFEAGIHPVAKPDPVVEPQPVFSRKKAHKQSHIYRFSVMCLCAFLWLLEDGVEGRHGVFGKSKRALVQHLTRGAKKCTESGARESTADTDASHTDSFEISDT